MTQFLEDPKQGVANLARYLNGLVKGLQRHPHLILSDEDLQADMEGQTAKALRFLRCKIDTVVLRKTVRASRFEAMRDMENADGIPDRGDDESLRRGRAGNFGEYLKPEHCSFIESTLYSPIVAGGETGTPQDRARLVWHAALGPLNAAA